MAGWKRSTRWICRKTKPPRTFLIASAIWRPIRIRSLAPYEQFVQDGKTYYFTPGGFLYRKDPGTEEVGGFFCGYLTDEVWDYDRSNDG
jgi:hypothetical protein